MKDLAGLLHLDAKFLNNPLSDWLLAAGIALTIILAASLIKRVAMRRLSVLAQRTSTHLDDAIVSVLRRTPLWLVSILAIWAGAEFLNLSHKTDALITKIATVAIFFQVGIWAGHLLEYWAARKQARSLTDSTAATASFGALLFVGRVLLWALILLLTLENLGINVNALVTSLGIGGVAVALAVQNILGDLFASLSIVLDKPFEVGDFIVIEDYMGSVEHVGLKSTRLRSLDGEQIVISNSDLLKSRLRNFKRMYERRVQFGFRIAYTTPVEKVEKIPDIARAIVERQKNVRFERSHFKKLAEASLDFEVVYWVTSADFNLYMDIQQAINLQLMSAMADAEINFAASSVVRVVDKPKALEDRPEKSALREDARKPIPEKA
ncbi:MAG TPA: mechanosensitive ion channel family protein [Nevskiaceae bacterium]|nr:mechanosensitive ion channel family protein [Nevskiaceae bacterium]